MPWRTVPESLSELSQIHTDSLPSQGSQPASQSGGAPHLSHPPPLSAHKHFLQSSPRTANPILSLASLRTCTKHRVTPPTYGTSLTDLWNPTIEPFTEIGMLSKRKKSRLECHSPVGNTLCSKLTDWASIPILASGQENCKMMGGSHGLFTLLGS